jgi:hypothetical protein
MGQVWKRRSDGVEVVQTEWTATGYPTWTTPEGAAVYVSGGKEYWLSGRGTGESWTKVRKEG